ncbi:tRNA pseudouridine synthase A [Enterococcus florum]|uniref:tRNA pseudouridine synthase A n=1 Tax=Enterococcus florum TaxID=2480627 RepID=A0A4P5PCS5_9ENTE|nr:tRNA pseudouridine(38-40) synthase TruA [Enterococcus florum]GCF94324.1 tRNA pseudouridine synthase A [Enterococcus florum]
MVRYKAIIAYDGTHFHGFQRQPKGRTVQEELEKTLANINNGEPITVFGSGRTDAGVHALGQVIHFDYPQERPVERMRFALDTQTPEDIAVSAVEIVPDTFHARYDVQEKTYHFHVQIQKPRSPFRRHYASYYPYPLDLDKIREALPDLLGTHDFTSFCATGGSIEDKVRTIYQAEMVVSPDGKELTFIFRGNGFLYKMIRILVGTLLKIGNGRMPADSIPAVLAQKDRNAAGPTAHPEGLYLAEVRYKEQVNKE